MTRLASVSHTRWAFYEAVESKDTDLMASWFETLYLHYQRRGKKAKPSYKTGNIPGGRK